MRHHVYLSPGMFGFGRLGSLKYFSHLERELRARFAAAGHELIAHVIDDLPTASVRRRAVRLAAAVAADAATTGGRDPAIHLLGHSTGGLDARVVASPATGAIAPAHLTWLPRLRSVTAMNTPHFGTPLASFFATSQGQRALAALSVLTVAGLSFGNKPLAIASAVLDALRGADRLLPVKIAAIDRGVSSVAGLIDDARGTDVVAYLRSIDDDQGAMIQLSPEAMDLVAAALPDRDGVAYRCTASMAPSPRPRALLSTLGHPWEIVSLPVFFALHRVTAAHSARYPCAALRGATAFAGDATEHALIAALGVAPTTADNDGIVPIRSQLWGELLWCGLGDHLDVLGHFRGERDERDERGDDAHRDWLASGSQFTARDFAALCDRIAAAMLAAAA